jgi:hypothetical protein
VVDVKTPLLRKAALALAVGGALGVGTAAGFGVASAVSDPSPTSTASPSATTPSAPNGQGNNHQGHGRRGGFPRAHGLLGQRIEHGEVTIKGPDGKPVVWDVQRGQVTAVSATSITVKSEDGFTATWTVTADTSVRIDKDKKSIGDIKTGSTVGIAGKKVGATATATVIGSK